MNQHLLHQLEDKAAYFIEHKMWLHATQIYWRMLNEFPALEPTYLKLASLYVEMGNFNAAEHALLKGLRRDNNNTEFLFALGMVFLQSNDASRARFYFERLIPHRIPRVHHALGLLAFEEADFVSAERHFTRVLELDPLFPDGVLTLVEVVLKNNQPVKAILLLQKYLSAKPQEHRALYLLGLAYSLNRQWNDAKSALEHAIEIDATDVPCLLSLSDVFVHTKEHRRAENILLDAARLQPLNTNIYLKLGRLWIIAGDKNRAHQYFLKALEIDPEQSDALESLQLIEPNGSRRP